MNKYFAFIILLAFVGYANAQCSVGQDNCVTCSDDNRKCSVCSSGYFMHLGVCYKCGENCIACSEGVQCGTCAFGYTASFIDCEKTSCSAGQLNCKTCGASPSTSSDCETCNDGYWLNTSKICGEAVCTANCITCKSASTCKTCANGYPLNANGTCGASSLSAILTTFFTFLSLVLLF